MKLHEREPIEHTCPDIDKYIRETTREIVKKRDLERLTESQFLSIAAAMSSQLEYCIDYFEKLRESNHTLRQWGRDEAKKVDELIDRIDELESAL